MNNKGEMLRQIGDIVHVRFFHAFGGDEWRPAHVISANDYKVAVQFHKTGEAMALHKDDIGRIWK